MFPRRFRAAASLAVGIAGAAIPAAVLAYQPPAAPPVAPVAPAPRV